MNIFEKLNAARLRFLKSGAKKSGYNSFSNYHYFELSDILPVINQAASELKFTCIASFGKEEAKLEVVDCEKIEDRVAFTSPMADLELKNNHPIQNLGAVQTYIRRYLYLMAFEICEGDALDAAAGKEDAKGARAAKKEAPAKGKQEKPANNVQADSGKLGIPAQVEAGKEMGCILEQSTYPDGSLVFSEADKERYREKVKKDKNYIAALRELKGELGERTTGWGLDHP